MEPREEGTKQNVASPGATRASQRYAMRVIHEDGRGVVLVYEAGPAPPQTGPKTLVFEWGHASAELAQYPSDWRRLGDDELLALRGGQDMRIAP